MNVCIQLQVLAQKSDSTTEKVQKIKRQKNEEKQVWLYTYLPNGKEQARKLQATLVRNYDPITYLLTYWRGWGVELLA